MDLLADIWNWLNSGIYDFYVEFWAWFIVKWTVFKLGFQALLFELSWDIAQEILESFKVMQTLESYFDLLDEETREMLQFFRIFEGSELLIKAFVTRFVLDFWR